MKLFGHFLIFIVMLVSDAFAENTAVRCAFDPVTINKRGEYFLIPMAEYRNRRNMGISSAEMINGRPSNFVCVSRSYSTERTDGMPVDRAALHSYLSVQCENAKTGTTWEPYVDMPAGFSSSFLKAAGSKAAWFRVGRPYFVIFDNSGNPQVFDALNRRGKRSDPFPLSNDETLQTALSDIDYSYEIFTGPRGRGYKVEISDASQLDQFSGIHAPLTFGVMPTFSGSNLFKSLLGPERGLISADSADVQEACKKGALTKISVAELNTYQILDQISRAVGYSPPPDYVLAHGDANYVAAIGRLLPELRRIHRLAVERNGLFVLISKETEGPYEMLLTSPSAPTKTAPPLVTPVKPTF